MSAGANATNELIGWIGLGAIGAPMAQRVAQAGWPLQVWNRDRAKAEALAMQGASVATTPAALAREAGIVCLCVTDAAAVEQVVFGPEGAAAGCWPSAAATGSTRRSPAARPARAKAG